VLAFVSVEYSTGVADLYLLPLTIAFDDEALTLKEANANAILAPIRSMNREGLLCDALSNASASQALLALMAQKGTLQGKHGTVRGVPSSIFAELKGANVLAPRLSSAEQSNTSIFFADRLIMKIFRRQEAGSNPDTEIGRFFTEKTQFRQVAPFGGSIEYVRDEQEPSTVAMLQGLVANQGDGWKWTLEELERYYESCATTDSSASKSISGEQNVTREAESAREHAGIYLEAAATLGRRTAEMHLALASSKDDAFRVETMSGSEIGELSRELGEHAARVMELLKENLSRLPDDAVEMAGLLLSRRREIISRFHKLTAAQTTLIRTRVHGDYHLGQVLRTKADFVILDFEGEPARSLAERRQKQSPLKDVAGMLRSFSYAAFSSLAKHTTRRPEDQAQMEPWAQLWISAVSEEFLRSYKAVVAEDSIVPTNAEDFQLVLDVYVLDKALYELGYELNNRPDWVRIPLTGILSLLS
jgi:maltose alpha-D-glucosyltransferase/alpha-amylase